MREELEALKDRIIYEKIINLNSVNAAAEARMKFNWLFYGGSGLGGFAQNGDHLPVNKRMYGAGISSQMFVSLAEFDEFMQIIKSNVATICMRHGVEFDNSPDRQREQRDDKMLGHDELDETGNPKP